MSSLLYYNIRLMCIFKMTMVGEQCGMLLVMDQIYDQYKADVDIQDDYDWRALWYVAGLDQIHALK